MIERFWLKCSRCLTKCMRSWLRSKCLRFWSKCWRFQPTCMIKSLRFWTQFRDIDRNIVFNRKIWGFDHNVSYFDQYVWAFDWIIRHFDINVRFFSINIRDFDRKVRDFDWNFWDSYQDFVWKVRVRFSTEILEDSD